MWISAQEFRELKAQIEELNEQNSSFMWEKLCWKSEAESLTVRLKKIEKELEEYKEKYLTILEQNIELAERIQRQTSF